MMGMQSSEALWAWLGGSGNKGPMQGRERLQRP